MTKRLHREGGIPHIEDLPLRSFIQIKDNVLSYRMTEKLDGSNIHFGIDDDGKFYTSRESKGGRRYYFVAEWGLKYWERAFKEAHAVLQEYVKLHPNVFLIGEEYEAEIVSRASINTVVYNMTTNKIFIIRAVRSTTTLEDAHNRLYSLWNESFSINFSVSASGISLDGSLDPNFTKNLYPVYTVYPDISSNVHYASYNDLFDVERLIEAPISELKSYVATVDLQTGLTYEEINEINLNKRPDSILAEFWSKNKTYVKTLREQVRQEIQQRKLTIKQIFLDYLVRKWNSIANDMNSPCNWIEGVVFLNVDTGEQFKVVDKNLFTAMNKFNWSVRYLVRNSTKSKKPSDVLTRYKNRIRAINSDVSFDQLKTDWITVTNYHINLLTRLYKIYNALKHKLTFEYTDGNFSIISTYSDLCLSYRTFGVFSDIYVDIKKTKTSLEQASNMEELLAVKFPWTQE